MLTALAVALLYAAGMVMNDLCDVEIDRRERPHRPLPSGRVSIRAARVFIIASLLVAPAGLALFRPVAGLAAAVLAGLIALYNCVHARAAISVLLLGACRALVYGVAIFAVSDRLPGGFEYPAAALLAYVALLSIVARAEALPGGVPARIPAWLLPWIPLPIVVPLLSYSASPVNTWWTLAACVFFVGWALFGVSRLYKPMPRVVHAVLIWLAGICLLDGIWLALLPRSALALAAWACFGLTVWAHRRILGT
jgi:4-hydroxybenzoate polyprenyltransferase